MLQINDLIRALQMDWGQHGPADVPTQFPGVPLDVTNCSAWCEFWVPQLVQQTQRQQTPSPLKALLDIHCFSRNREDKREVVRIVDHVRGHYAQYTLDIFLSDDPQQCCGLIRFFEPTVRDLSRVKEQNPQQPWQHQIVSLTASVSSLI